VRRGDATAYLIVRKGFGESLRSFSGDSQKLDVGIDPTRQAEAGMLQGLLTEATFSVLFRQFSDPKEMTRWVKMGRKEIERADELTGEQKSTLKEFLGMLDEFIPKLDAAKMPADGGPFTANRMKVVPVTFDQAKPRSAWEVTFPSSIMWALLSCMTSFAVSIVIERKAGTLLRLRIAPLSRGQILAGEGLACFLSCAAAALVLLALGIAIFDVRVGNWMFLLTGVACAALCFAGLMMLLSVLGRTEQAVSGSASASMVVMAMFGGGMIPLFAMPDWMQTVSNISPVKWGILGLEGAIWRGFSAGEMLLPCAVLVTVGVVSFVVGVRILSRRDF
jgi:ABC-2 type transport system permease protein